MSATRVRCPAASVASDGQAMDELLPLDEVREREARRAHIPDDGEIEHRSVH